MCKSHSHYREQIRSAVAGILPSPSFKRLDSSIWNFFAVWGLLSLIIAIMLALIFFQMKMEYPLLESIITTILAKVFFVLLIISGVSVWIFLLTSRSRNAAQQEVHLQTESLMKEISAHEKTARQLKSAKESADRANKAKSQHLTRISHELRTPLNALTGYVQLIENASDIPADRRLMIQVIRRSGEHLTNLIEGLLDFSKIEAGRLEIHNNEFRLPDFMKQLVDLFTNQAARKELQFIYRTQSLFPDIVKTDENRLRQILVNILSNAIKFTERGSVTLDFSYRNQVARFTVTDTGIGIKKKDLERIFKPFERISHPDHHWSGTGLGLAISKHLVWIMGGDLQVESQPGRGSVFRLQMLLPSVDWNMASIPPEKQSITGAIGNGHTLMVVDDDQAHRQLMRDTLTPLGFVVILAKDARECLQLCQQHAIDLFLLDIFMPGMSGWRLLSILRTQAYYQPVMMISASPEVGEGEKNRNISEGVHADVRYMVKPIRLSALIDNIVDILELHWEREASVKRALPPHAYTHTEEKFVLRLSDEENESLVQMARMGYAKGLYEELARLHGENKINSAALSRLNQCIQHFRFEQLIADIKEITSR
jgi:signal transduction histidine kinase/CheY-like chemotaxis protein